MFRSNPLAFRRGSSEVEHALGKGGVGGSIPPRGTIKPLENSQTCPIIPGRRIPASSGSFQVLPGEDVAAVFRARKMPHISP